MASASRHNNTNFAHYICTDDYPGGANRLLIGIYFEACRHRPTVNWACFIAASFYDRRNRIVWHKTVCFVLWTEESDTVSLSRESPETGEFQGWI